jgi:Ras GTPase-activating-like protein IQGAP2/3
LIAVEDPEEVLGVHKYMELTQKKAPSITITWNEIFSTHQLLLKYLHKLATIESDPLRSLLKSMGETAPEEVALEKNEELSLQLINAEAKDSLHDNQVNPDQLYDETKENFRVVLRSLPPDQLGENVVDTIENAKKFASTASQRANVDPNIIKVLSEKVKHLEESLPKLEEAQLVTRSNNYRKILIDITKEIQNRKIVRAKQQKELERLKESLKSLQEHSKFLQDKINDLQVYIQQSVQKHFDDGAKNRRKKVKSKGSDQVHKFSFKQLYEKHKVIEELNVIKSQQNKFKFFIKMTEPGKFDVEAKLAGLTVNTIQLDLADLLDRQSKQQQSIKFEDVTLNVNMTIHILNRLFVEV